MRYWPGVVALLCLLATGSPSHAQERPPSPPLAPATRPPIVPLEVQVVISRYQGEKLTGRVPYMLAVNANSQSSQLNMGAEVPVPTGPRSDKGSADGGEAIRAVQSFNYRSVGTSIECHAVTVDEGLFELLIAVDESTVLTGTDAKLPDNTDVPVFRSFKSRNRLLLRDGQTRQYSAATDRVTGETVRVEVTLKLVK